jgi:hypothetical protein
MPLVTDNARQPDEDNPNGYFEFEKAKTLRSDSSWLQLVEGKALKVVSMLLYDLPSDRRYQVIFMTRAMAEVLASQGAMLRRRGTGADGPSDAEMRRHYENHLSKVERWLRAQPHIEVLHCSYNDVLKDPAGQAKRVAEFLDAGLDVGLMAGAVDPSLYRQKAKER